MAKIKLYAIGGLVVLLTLAVWEWRSEIRNAAQWAVGVQQLEQQIRDQEARLQADRERRAREDAQRLALQRELASIRDQQQQMARDFHELERSDEDVAQWADGRLPDALIERLQ